MSDYYNPHRNANWNYGGSHWKLSRSKIDLFLECPRCFYLDNKLGTKRPPGYPFTLNSAVDHLLKLEFDIHRKNGKPHPLIEKYGVEARPVEHASLGIWRDNFVGVQYLHPETGILVTGAIDDLWINPQDEYIVVDYKSTAKSEKIESLDKDWHESYKRQMEVYQWLLRQNHHRVSNTGYFVYCNGITDKEAFDAKLEFDLTLISHQGNDAWVNDSIIDIKHSLEKDTLPPATSNCDYCAYHQAVNQLESSQPSS